jgi:hypothetical protein
MVVLFSVVSVVQGGEERQEPIVYLLECKLFENLRLEQRFECSLAN